MKKKPTTDREVRQIITGLEVRAIDDTSRKTIGGYALRYNQQSEVMRDWWGDRFVEEFATGAFDASLQKRNQKALWNHRADMPLGSVQSGTLRFNSDTTGLNYDVDLPNNTWGNDAYESIQRRDVDGSSFGFKCLNDKWSEVEVNGEMILKRTILEAELFEVSPATFPAYNSSEINCRSLDSYREEKQKAEKRKKIILLTQI
jgi:HK97 family phage prohead protease